MTPFIKNTLILCSLIVVGGVGYYLFIVNDKGSVVTVGVDLSAVQTTLETQDFLRKLNELEIINLSDQLFADDRFITLIDNNKPVEAIKIGRNNPFAPAF